MTFPLAPGNWADRAACRGNQEAMLLPERPRHAIARGSKLAIHIANAKLICGLCPVYHQCRQWASQDPDPAIGLVAGGMTDRERNTAIRLRRVS